MVAAALKEVSGILDRRFLVNVFFPSLVFWSLLIAVWFAGKGELSTVIRSWPEQETIYEALEVFGFLSGVFLFAAVISNLSSTIVRLFEGYWKFPLADWPRRIGERWHRHRLAEIAEAAKTDQKRYQEIYLGYPLRTQMNEVMPTRLGNILKNAELYSKNRYRIDAVLIWPRLYNVFPPEFVQLIGELRSGLDHMLLLVLLGTFFALTTGAYLIWSKASPLLFLICFGGGYFVAVMGYRGALGVAQLYAQQVKAAFDLYRNDLLVKMHVPLPKTRAKELETWREISTLLYHNRLSDSSTWIYESTPTSESSPGKP